MQPGTKMGQPGGLFGLGATLFGTALLLLGCSDEPNRPPAPNSETTVLSLVEECDVLAAHPSDPQRMSEGVADKQIVPRLAIIACEDAVERVPDEARFPFQLGRAHLARGDRAKAFELFNQSASAGYGAAHGYVGDAYQFGEGAAVDPEKAKAAYEKAIQAGFEVASAQLDQLRFDAALYTGTYLQNFFHSNLGPVRADSEDGSLAPIVRNYIFSLTQQLSQECPQVLQPANGKSLYNYRYPLSWSPQSDEQVGVAVQTALGEQDAKTFLRRHGCDGPVAKHVFANLNQLLSQYRQRQ
jgi:TPR repeat protein